MHQLVYVMRFMGQVTAAGPDGMVLMVTASAPGMTLAMTVDHTCLTYFLEAGGKATFMSELTLTGKTSFQEVGTVVMGNGHRLHFATVGSGYLGADTDLTSRNGAVIWQVDGGEGRFAGVRGLITSNFSLDADHGMVSHHLGVLVMP
jgi:hypothetical protein